MAWQVYGVAGLKSHKGAPKGLQKTFSGIFQFPL